MKILKRTQGIDTRAKSGTLRGDVCFQLRDVDTGKVKEEFRGHNMLTNGLDSSLNKCPFGLNKIGAMYSNVNPSKFELTPIYQQLLGGVILFPSALGNDADLLFPSFDNSPTAFASCESYTQTDSRQGTYVDVESLPITNGFKHVFAWGSSYGNGTIASLGLAPRNAHTWCYGVSNMLKPHASIRGGYYMQYSGNMRILAVCDTGVLTTINNNLYFYKLAPLSLNLFENLGSNTALGNTTAFDVKNNPNGYAWTYALSLAPQNFTAEIIGSYVYIITKSGSTVTVRKLNLSDGTLASTDTYTYSGVTFGTGKAVLYGNYIYCTSSTAGTLYKCSIVDTTIVDDIANTAITANQPLFYVGSQFIYADSFMLDASSDEIVAFDSTLFDYGSRQRQFPIWDNGMWLVFYGSGVSGTDILPSMCASMKQWGLMTHYDLPDSVTKDTSEQMVINYSITQV